MIKVQSVQVVLSEMMDNPGRNLQRFQEELNGAVYKEHTLTHVVAQNLLTQERGKITQELRDCLDSRFSNLQEPIYKSCNIFDHSNWPDEKEALTQYSRNELQVITDHFQHILNNCGCDVDSAFSEWTELKLHVKNNPHFRVLHPLSVEFSTSSISFSFISVPSGICFVFLSRACSKICMFVNIPVFKLSRSLQFF